MIPKYFILKHIITGEYNIASITEWGSKYTLDDYILVTSTDSLEFGICQNINGKTYSFR